MRRLLVQTVILIGLATPAISSELQRSPASSLHEALWPLSKPGSVYPSAHIARQSKPEDAVGRGPNVPAGRSEAQQPIPAWSIRKEAIQLPSSARILLLPPLAHLPKGSDDVRARASRSKRRSSGLNEWAGVPS